MMHSFGSADIIIFQKFVIASIKDKNYNFNT